MSNIYAITDSRWSNGATTYSSIWMDVNNGAGGSAVGAAASRLLKFTNNGVEVFGINLLGGLIYGGVTLTNSPTGTGKMVLDTAPTISQPNLVGTTTNDNAAAGSVGEYISGTLIRGSATALVSTTAKTIISIALTAGDWDLWATVGINFGGGTTVSLMYASISPTNNTNVSVAAADLSSIYQNNIPYTSANDFLFGLSPIRVSLAAPATYYLVIAVTFAVSTANGYGTLAARRVR